MQPPEQRTVQDLPAWLELSGQIPRLPVLCRELSRQHGRDCLRTVHRGGHVPAFGRADSVQCLHRPPVRRGESAVPVHCLQQWRMRGVPRGDVHGPEPPLADGVCAVRAREVPEPERPERVPSGDSVPCQSVPGCGSHGHDGLAVRRLCLQRRVYSEYYINCPINSAAQKCSPCTGGSSAPAFCAGGSEPKVVCNG